MSPWQPHDTGQRRGVRRALHPKAVGPVPRDVDDDGEDTHEHDRRGGEDGQDLAPLAEGAPGSGVLPGRWRQGGVPGRWWGPWVRFNLWSEGPGDAQAQSIVWRGPQIGPVGTGRSRQMARHRRCHKVGVRDLARGVAGVPRCTGPRSWGRGRQRSSCGQAQGAAPPSCVSRRRWPLGSTCGAPEGILSRGRCRGGFRGR